MIHDHGPQDLLRGVPPPGGRALPVHSRRHACAGSRPIWGSPEAPWPPGLPRLTRTRRPARSGAAAPAAGGGTARPRPGSPQAELAALRARVAALETENTLLATERDILRQAAKYFAGETRW